MTPPDRDKRTVKTPPAGVLAQTAVPLEQIENETSAAIDDPGARQAWREANRTLTERVARTEERIDEVAGDTAETKGYAKAILAISEKSNEEREKRAARDIAADRRNKIILAILSLAAAALGIHLGAG